MKAEDRVKLEADTACCPTQFRVMVYTGEKFHEWWSITTTDIRPEANLVVGSLERAIAAAVAEERERCEQAIMDEHDSGNWRYETQQCLQRCLAAIRKGATDGQ